MMPVPRAQKKGPVFPWITVSLCLAMLLLHALIGPSGADPALGPQRLALLDAGAKSASLLSDTGEGWRVLSAHLVHTGWVHLLFNLAFLFPVAAALECVLIRIDFVLAISLISVSSGLASLIWTPEISAGASGLVYGVLGTAVLVGLRFSSQLSGRIRMHFGLWVLPFLLLILFFGANNPNLDHHNHLGGLVAGLALVPLLRLRPRYAQTADPSALQRQNMRRTAALTLVVSATVLLSPRLVRTLSPARHLECLGMSLWLPSSWGAPIPAPKCGVASNLSARVSVPNSSTMVSVELARIPYQVPRGLNWQDAWQEYREHLVDPRAPQASVRDWSDACSVPQHHTGQLHCEQALTYVREGVAMRALVRWFRAPGHWLTVRFEAPIHWWDKYQPTREKLFASVHPFATNARRDVTGSIVRAAIP